MAAGTFHRCKLLSIIVRVAIARFVEDGDEKDVSTAIDMMCDHIVKKLSSVPETMQARDRAAYL